MKFRTMDGNPGNQRNKKNYRSFLLRLWRVIRNGKGVWLAGLEDPHTGEQESFTSLEELLVYLKKQINEND